MSKQDKKIDGVSYNVEYWKKWSEADFIKQNLAEGAFPELETEAEKIARLKQHYAILHPPPTPEKEKEVVPVDQSKKKGE